MGWVEYKVRRRGELERSEPEMNDRGTKVSVGIVNDGSVEGWLYGENPLGVYVSLDPNGEHIRFIPSGQWSGIGYSHQSPKAIFASEMQEIDGDFREAMYNSLLRVDYNYIGRLGRSAHNLEYRATRYRDALRSEGPFSPFYEESENRESFLVLSIEAREIYSALLGELLRSGVGEVLLDFGERLRQQTSLDTLPLIDAHASPADLVSQLKEVDNLQNSMLGRTVLDQVTPERLVKSVQAEVGNGNPPENQEKLERTWGTRLKRIAAVGKMALGSGLAVSNLGLGAIAGVVSALPTLGLGTVAAVVGIATSTYTGLNAACDGLKDLAGTLEAT